MILYFRLLTVILFSLPRSMAVHGFYAMMSTPGSPEYSTLPQNTRKYLLTELFFPKKNTERRLSPGEIVKTRLITLRNISWLPVTRTIKLDEEIGLGKGSVVELRQYHPVERVIGRFKRGETVNIEVLPFRSSLLLATTEKEPDHQLKAVIMK